MYIMFLNPIVSHALIYFRYLIIHCFFQSKKKNSRLIVFHEKLKTSLHSLPHSSSGRRVRFWTFRCMHGPQGARLHGGRRIEPARILATELNCPRTELHIAFLSTLDISTRARVGGRKVRCDLTVSDWSRTLPAG